MCHFFACFSENRLKRSFRRIYLKIFRDFYRKNEISHLIFYYKNKYISKFHAFAIKADIGNMSKSKEFRLKSDSKSAQVFHFVIFFYKNNCLKKKRYLRIENVMHGAKGSSTKAHQSYPIHYGVWG